MSNRDKVKAIPEDYASVIPYIIVKGVAQFIDFLEQAFGAVERFRVYNDDSTIGHAEVWIGNSIIMMFDAQADWPETPGFFTLWVEDCDKVHESALKAGATTITDLATNAWGDRGSRIRDPFGNIWWVQTHVEDVSEEEIGRRMNNEHFINDMQKSAETLDYAIRKQEPDADDLAGRNN